MSFYVAICLQTKTHDDIYIERKEQQPPKPQFLMVLVVSSMSLFVSLFRGYAVSSMSLCVVVSLSLFVSLVYLCSCVVSLFVGGFCKHHHPQQPPHHP